MKKNKKSKGFTLVELVVVILIVAVLAMTALPAIISFQSSARKSRIQSEFRLLIQAVQTYVAESGGETYPSNINELARYVNGGDKPLDTVLAKDKGRLAHKIVGKELQSTYTDIYGTPHVYRYDVTKVSN